MPFSRPSLTVGPGAHAAPDARHWVVAALTEIGRPELAETAELGVSELVGNAFRHGSDPIEICLRGEVTAPRIEVRDASSVIPTLPGAFEPEKMMAEGRGLALVARAASAWGIAVEPRGKVIWFVPAVDLSDEPTPATIEDHKSIR